MRKFDSAPQGTYVVFSCQAKTTASDGAAGKMGLLAAACLAHLGTPGLSLDTLGMRLTKHVKEESHGKQIPDRHSSITAEDSFLVAVSVGVPPCPPPP
jgi:hypothetical protein